MKETIYWKHGCKVTIRKIVTHSAPRRHTRVPRRFVRYSVKVTNGPHVTVDSALRMPVARRRAESMVIESFKKNISRR